MTSWIFGLLKAYDAALLKYEQPKIIALGTGLIRLAEIAVEIAADLTLSFQDKKDLWTTEKDACIFILKEATFELSDIPKHTFVLILEIISSPFEKLFDGE